MINIVRNLDKNEFDKKNQRQYIRIKKQTYTRDELVSKSAKIWSKIEDLEVFKSSKIILAYWSLNDEVYTHSYIVKWAKEKTILLPCINGDELELRCFNGLSQLVKEKYFDISEPIGDLFIDFDNIDMALVPGMAFDLSGGRLGRGKGYYDKLLPNLNAFKVGLAFDFQILDKIVCVSHDVLMDEVVCDAYLK